MPSFSNANSNVVEISTAATYMHTSANPVPQGTPGFGGGGGGMESSVPMKEYVDARDDAIESRLAGKFDRLPGKGALWGGVAATIGGIFTAVAIILASLSFGSDRFNDGLSVSPILAKIQEDQRKTDLAQDAKLELMDRKLDILIERVPPR